MKYKKKKKTSDTKLVSLYSTMEMMHGPINIMSSVTFLKKKCYCTLLFGNEEDGFFGSSM